MTADILPRAAACQCLTLNNAANLMGLRHAVWRRFYQVESSPGLKTWTVASGPSGQSAANSLSTFTDTIPGTMKFYRVKPLL